MESVSDLLGPSAWIVYVLAIFYALYKYGTKNFDFFTRQGIPGPKPIPFFGNLWGLWKTNLVDQQMEEFKKYGKLYGKFEGTKPNIYIGDCDLVRSVLVKDFDHFINRRDLGIKDEYLRSTIDNLRDHQWKKVRTAVTPAFSSGKVKKMSLMMKKSADQFADRLASKIESEGHKHEIEGLFTTYVVDVISKCAFGMHIENLGGEDDEISKRASKIFSSEGSTSPAIVIPLMFPSLLRLLTKYLFSDELRYITNLIASMVKDRFAKGQRLDDFVDMARASINDLLKETTEYGSFSKEEIEEVIIAQAAIFFSAGLDTSSITLSSTIYLLAKNPEVQQKLLALIDEKLEQHGEICHEMFVDFPYIDQVINEVQRFYSPAIFLERECNKDITYDQFHIKKGMLVTVAVNAIHYSKEYYDEPEKFDPERWDPANKGKLHPYAYLPFGTGPRNCIGMRFALESMKIAICTMVKRFELFAVEETADKLRVDNGMQQIFRGESVIGIKARN